MPEPKQEKKEAKEAPKEAPKKVEEKPKKKAEEPKKQPEREQKTEKKKEPKPAKEEAPKAKKEEPKPTKRKLPSEPVVDPLTPDEPKKKVIAPQPAAVEDKQEFPSSGAEDGAPYTIYPPEGTMPSRPTTDPRAAEQPQTSVAVVAAPAPKAP